MANRPARADDDRRDDGHGAFENAPVRRDAAASAQGNRGPQRRTRGDQQHPAGGGRGAGFPGHRRYRRRQAAQRCLALATSASAGGTSRPAPCIGSTPMSTASVWNNPSYSPSPRRPRTCATGGSIPGHAGRAGGSRHQAGGGNGRSAEPVDRAHRGRGADAGPVDAGEPRARARLRPGRRAPRSRPSRRAWASRCSTPRATKPSARRNAELAVITRHTAGAWPHGFELQGRRPAGRSCASCSTRTMVGSGSSTAQATLMHPVLQGRGRRFHPLPGKPGASAPKSSRTSRTVLIDRDVEAHRQERPVRRGCRDPSGQANSAYPKSALVPLVAGDVSGASSA